MKRSTINPNLLKALRLMLVAFGVLTISVNAAAATACLSAPALPNPSGTVVTVSDVSQLESASTELDQ